MGKKNYKSDFSFFLELYDRNGEPIGFPTCNFRFSVTSDCGGRVYRGFRHGKRLVNVAEYEGRMLIICNRHGLMPGRVSVEIELAVPNPVYPDGFEDVVKVVRTDVELVPGNSDDDCPGFAEMSLPVVGIKPDCGCDTNNLVEATEEDIEKLVKEIFDGEKSDDEKEEADS